MQSQDQPSPAVFEHNQKRAVYIQLAIFVIPMLLVAFIPLLMALFPAFVVRLASAPAVTETEALICGNGLKTYDTDPKVCRGRGGVKRVVRNYDCQRPDEQLMIKPGGKERLCFRQKLVGHMLGFRKADEYGNKTVLP